MRKLRRAAAVALMVGSVGMLGAGTAAAGDGWHDGGLKIFNPQSLPCIYTGNTVTAPVNTATTGTGNAFSPQVIGNICPQTGPNVF